MSPHDDALLQDLLDGRLDAAEAEAVRERLDQEAPLREAWDELRRVQDLVRRHAAEVEPPADFLVGVRARIAAAASSDVPTAPSSRPAPRPRWLKVLTVAYAAAALVVVGFTVKYVLEGPSPEGATPPPTEMAKEDAGPAAGAVEDDRAREVQGEPQPAAPDAEARVGGRRERDKLGVPKDAADAPRPAAPREAEAPAGFAGAGGAVKPGLRSAADSPAAPDAPQRRARQPEAPARSAPTSPASPPAPGSAAPPPTPAPAQAPAAEGAADAKAGSAPEVLFVLETEDAPGAERRLARLLDRLLGVERKDAGLDGREAANGRAKAAVAAERLVRVPAAQAALLRSAFERQERARAEAGPTRASGAPRLAWRATVRRTLPSAVVEQLEQASLAGAPSAPSATEALGRIAERSGASKKAAPVPVRILILERAAPPK